MADENKSIRWIVIVAMIFVAYLGWGFMAGSYAENTHAAGLVVGRRGSAAAVTLLASAVYTFVITSILEIPHLFQVISWHLSNRIWLPGLFVILEIAIIGGGIGLHRLEQKLSGPPTRRKR